MWLLFPPGVNIWFRSRQSNILTFLGLKVNIIENADGGVNISVSDIYEPNGAKVLGRCVPPFAGILIQGSKTKGLFSTSWNSLQYWHFLLDFRLCVCESLTQ